MKATLDNPRRNLIVTLCQSKTLSPCYSTLCWSIPQSGLLIEEIFPDGNAYRDGRLSIGDRIIEIDGQDFSQKTLAQATLALSAAVPLIRLTVMRQIEEDGERDVYLCQ